RFQAYLRARKLWSDADEQRAYAEADARVTEGLQAVEKIGPPDLETLYEDVYAEMPWHLREELEEARA
ncbi:MAG TPA: pyruvate dehydrogenase (acetyl-transferring) E1 component subunit alpha, partial [Armatimonadota bacterium]|nr:pyruvate dehydrogenase (acetyl-transferring) E1 component subunit alpha [Armatimonadota bacterium]